MTNKDMIQYQFSTIKSPDVKSGVKSTSAIDSPYWFETLSWYNPYANCL